MIIMMITVRFFLTLFEYSRTEMMIHQSHSVLHFHSQSFQNLSLDNQSLQTPDSKLLIRESEPSSLRWTRYSQLEKISTISCQPKTFKIRIVESLLRAFTFDTIAFSSFRLAWTAWFLRDTVSTVEPPCRDCNDRGSPRPAFSFTFSSLAMVKRTNANWTMFAMICVWHESSQMWAAVKLELAGTFSSTEIPENQQYSTVWSGNDVLGSQHEIHDWLLLYIWRQS